MNEDIRFDWQKDEIEKIYHHPLLPLISWAHEVHKRYHKFGEIQLATLLSVKTGSCPEDCAQSSRYKTPVESEMLMDEETVLEKARLAKAAGSSRFCLGAAWRRIPKGRNFQKLLKLVSRVHSELGLEVCVSAGTLDVFQAKALKDSGCFAYNHNLDSSKKHYPNFVTTRTYDERLENLERIQKAGLSVCTGGILGLGETHDDRIDLIHTLSQLQPHPDSVPINRLIPISGTPLATMEEIPFWDFLRTLATARIVLPRAVLRLSAGRKGFSYQDQALCFMAGANSIHTGEKLLTQDNCGSDQDKEMMGILGLHSKPLRTESNTLYVSSNSASETQ